ncbi:MAG: response regulator [Elusimicrobia bacterium]|nr:response regulator [Elusimicrobiota bacterium]
MRRSGRLVILIAEDDPSDLFFLQKAFEEKCPGAEVRDVPDGQAAIEYLSGEGPYADRASFPLPACVLLDVKMPRRSGLEVLQWIREAEGLAQLSVTVLSGSELAQDMEQARRLGAEYLVKPVRYADLLELVERYCRRFER